MHGFRLIGCLGLIGISSAIGARAVNANPPDDISKYLVEIHDHILQMQLEPPAEPLTEPRPLVVSLIALILTIDESDRDALNNLIMDPRERLADGRWLDAIRQNSLRHVAQTNAEAADLWAREFAQSPVLSKPPASGPAMEWELRALWEARTMTSIFLINAVDATIIDQLPLALERFHNAALLASVTARRGLFLPFLVAQGQMRATWGAMIDVARSTQLNRDEIVQLLDLLRDGPQLSSTTDWLEVERLAFLDLLVWIHTDKGILHVKRCEAVMNELDQDLRTIPGEQSPFAQDVGLAFPSLTEMIADYNAYSDKVRAFVELPPHQRASAEPPPDPIDPGVFPDLALAKALVPSWDFPIRRHDDFLRDRELAILTLAAEAASRRLDQWPESQNELIGFELTKPILDPITLQPLAIELTQPKAPPH